MKIPAGAADGTRVRIAGEGSAGMAGGPRGDLYVVTKVRPHARFERKGDDLIEEVPVPVEDAVLGGEVEVETIARQAHRDEGAAADAEREGDPAEGAGDAVAQRQEVSAAIWWRRCGSGYRRS